MEEQGGVTAAGDLRPHRKLTSAEHSADSEEMDEPQPGGGNSAQPSDRPQEDEEEAESCDHYSQKAMDELERLKLNDEDDDECAEKHVKQPQQQVSSPQVAQVAETDRQYSNAPATMIPRAKGGKSSPLPAALSPSTLTQWEVNGTPGKKTSANAGGGRRKNSGVRPRPMSMVVSPHAEILTRAWQEDSDGCPGSSEEHLGGSSEDVMSECSFGSRADLDRLLDGPVPSWVQCGQPASVASSRGGPPKSGLIRFVGSVEFAHGVWVGMELDLPEGKNDGSVKGVRYFQCKSRHGVFVRPDKLVWMDVSKRKNSRKGPGSVTVKDANHRHSLPAMGGSLTNLNAGGGGYMRGTTASSLKRK
ncbi:hypothetical protein EGW08_003354 [Elysia chlorotica]|uniref:CAP-Gly domain-containing protein n=1 Tax=Elysia chlorotica TaxID=188477 RepID=A0A3S0ZX56_ELYCH|nr:hypothetical protein EGW08_003354 [Elysia chlorotica]